MTNTYPDDAPIEVKIHEELRVIRCAMERLMRIMDEGMFVDYQMEKFNTIWNNKDDDRWDSESEQEQEGKVE